MDGDTTRKSLIDSEALLPDRAIIDPVLTFRGGLTDALSEVLVRALAAYLEAATPDSQADAAGRSILARTLSLAEGAPPVDKFTSPAWRLRLYELSMLSVAGAHLRTWHPRFPAWWCVQNELSVVTGMTKGTLGALFYGQVLDQVGRGAPLWGGGSRLDELLNSGDDLVQRVLQWLEQAAEWGTRTVTSPEVTLATQRTFRYWSHHPSVAALGEKGILRVLQVSH